MKITPVLPDQKEVRLYGQQWISSGCVFQTSHDHNEQVMSIGCSHYTTRLLMLGQPHHQDIDGSWIMELTLFTMSMYSPNSPSYENMDTNLYGLISKTHIRNTFEPYNNAVYLQQKV
jgi:hypothetical protein